ncbi:MAG: glycosyltransferase [Thermoplasmata archaeon]
MKRLAIVILNWNGEGFLRKFLPSVTKHSKGDHITIWVADNGSQDSSLAFLKENYPHVSLLEFVNPSSFRMG